jgi:hypothetical protein
VLERWRATLTQPHESGSSVQSWFWSPPAKHSTRQIDEMIERIETLYDLRVHKCLKDFPDEPDAPQSEANIGGKTALFVRIEIA